MDILVLGGTKFFGRHLVLTLLEAGHTVTVATRGQTSDDFEDRVRRLHVDRQDARALRAALQGRDFDVVYDQLCFTPREARDLLEILAGHAGRYCLTSSGSVYEGQEGLLTEDDFDPWAYAVDLEAATYTYAEGKRQAEAYAFQRAEMPVVAARVTFVISGTDDYTGRFDFQVRHVADNLSLGVWPDDFETCFVTAWDAGRFLAFAGTATTETGPVNVANPGYLSARALALFIGRHLHRTPRFHATYEGDPDRSPYAVPATLCLNVERAHAWGFRFPPLEPQLPAMIDAVIARTGVSPA